MPHLSRFALLAAILSACASAESVDDVFNRMDKTAPDFQGFSAKMKQTQYTKVLDSTDQFDGVIRLRRTGQGIVGIVRFLDKNPHTVHFTGGGVEIFNPVADQLDVYDTAKYTDIMKQFLLLGFGSKSNEIRKDYVVKDGGAQMVGSVRATRIELTPKSAEIKKLAAKIELWIPEGESNPIKEKGTQPSGDYNEFVYSNLKLLKLPASDPAFTFDPDQKPSASTHKVLIK